MEITNKNFPQFIKEFELNVKKCEFMSFDFEMTGISMSQYPELIFDTPAERYNKMRAVAMKFNLIQMGITLFSQKGENHYEALPYNLYVFPREVKGFSPIVTLDASAIEFNMKHNMDFQKWIYEGISYMNKKTYEVQKANLFKEFPREDVILNMSPEIKAKTETVTKELADWFSKDNFNESFVIAEENPAIRRFYYSHLELNYKLYSTVKLDADKTKKNGIEVFRYKTIEEKKQFDEKIKIEQLENLEKSKGFLKVFELMVQSKKPLVGHKLLYDLLFFYSHFDSLDNEYKAFKSKLHQNFPEIYDTKYLAINSTLKDLFSESGTSLGIAHKVLHFDKERTKDITVEFPPGFEGYRVDDPENLSGSPKYHEAGFDALVTGYVYLKLKSGLGEAELSSLKNRLESSISLYDLSLDMPRDIIKTKAPNKFIAELPPAPEDEVKLEKLKSKLTEFNVNFNVKKLLTAAGKKMLAAISLFPNEKQEGIMNMALIEQIYMETGLKVVNLDSFIESNITN